MLVPRYLNTDPIIKVYEKSPGDIVPISGWYGPGAWIAYVLTALSAVCRMLRFTWHTYQDHERRDYETCEECSQHRDWDPDLIVSLIYTSISAIDLIRHSSRILRTSEPRMDEVSIMPAVQASLTAVIVGCGFAYILFIPLLPLFTMTFSHFRFVSSYWRRLLPVFVLLLITYGAIFTFRCSQVVLTSEKDRDQTSRGTAYDFFAIANMTADGLIREARMSLDLWYSLDRLIGIPVYLYFFVGWSAVALPWIVHLDTRPLWVKLLFVAHLLIAFIIPMAIFLTWLSGFTQQVWC
jgi:hypothetical protein